MYRIEYTGDLSPYIGTQPASLLVSVGQPGVFTVEASGRQPVGDQWQRRAGAG